MKKPRILHTARVVLLLMSLLPLITASPAGADRDGDAGLSPAGAWVNAGLPAGCPDWARYDAEYYEGTGRAYLMGGRSGNNSVGHIYAFDPNARACTDTGVDMPTLISNYTIVTLRFADGDRLCTFGGRTADGGGTAAVQCYSPRLNNIVTKKSLPGAFAGYIPGGAAAVNNKAYIFGGYRSSPAPYNLAVTYEYDPLTNAYTARGSMAVARGYIITAVVDNMIYAFGGDIFNGSALIAQDRAERYNPATNLWSDSAVPELPAASGEGRAFGFDHGSGYEFAGRIILAGGGVWPNQTAAALIYDVDSRTYDDGFPDLNAPHRNHAAFFRPGSRGQMWVMGGNLSGDNPPYGPAESYDVQGKFRGFLPNVPRK